MPKKYVLPAIFTAEDKLSSKVSMMSSKVGAKMDLMERKFKKVSKKAMEYGRKFAITGLAITAPLGILANEAIKFESQMSNISTLIDTRTESIDKMGEKVLDLAQELPVPIEELTSSLYDIRSAGIAADKQFSTLETSAKLSSAGLSDVSESTDILTSALNAFRSQGLSADQTADILFKTVKNGKTTISELSQAFGATAPIVQSAGVKLEDFSAATAAITTTGTPASQAQNQIRASVIALQKPTESMIKIYKKLGVTSGEDLIKKYGSLGKAYDAINSKSKEMNLNNGKVWGSTEALAAVTSITGETNQTYLNTLDDMTNGSNALNEAYKKQAGTGKAQMQILKNQLQSVAITLGQALLPVIIDIVKWITPMIKSFAAWAKRNKGMVRTIAKIAVVAAGLSFALSGIAYTVGLVTKAMKVARVIMVAWRTVVAIATTAQIVWNAALNANPIGVIIIAVTALSAAVYGLSRAMSSQTTEQKLNNEVNSRALENSIDQRVEVTMLFAQLRKLEAGTQAYTNVLQKIDEIQPGITEKYNLQAGALRDMAAAEKELTENILNRAKMEARAELIKEKYKEIEEMKQAGITGMSTYDLTMSGLTGRNTYADKIKQLEKEAKMLTEQQVQAQIEEDQAKSDQPVNIDEARQTVQKEITEKSTMEKLMIEFGNMPEGTTVSGSAGSGVTVPAMTPTS